MIANETTEIRNRVGTMYSSRRPTKRSKCSLLDEVLFRVGVRRRGRWRGVEDPVGHVAEVVLHHPEAVGQRRRTEDVELVRGDVQDLAHQPLLLSGVGGADQLVVQLHLPPHGCRWL